MPENAVEYAIRKLAEKIAALTARTERLEAEHAR